MTLCQELGHCFTDRPLTNQVQQQSHFDFHILSLEVESDLQLEVVHNWCEDFHPGLLERSKPVEGYWNLTKLWTPSLQANMHAHDQESTEEWVWR